MLYGKMVTSSADEVTTGNGIIDFATNFAIKVLDFAKHHMNDIIMMCVLLAVGFALFESVRFVGYEISKRKEELQKLDK